ncbi:MAG: hypothetical protein EHM93_01435 [Bacteroidales bacterium]|nr:MAG: hypothetical protein EHM93_01435 [Bacteroidales bacterium]
MNNILCCDKHLEQEFQKVEKKIKFIAIPVFIAVSFIYITDIPIANTAELWCHIINSIVGILSIWAITRTIIHFFKYRLPNLNHFLRITLQLILSISLSILCEILLLIVNENIRFLNHYHHLGVNELKNLMIATFLFTLLVNAIYEGFYLFLRLAQSALVTERYRKESVEAKYQNLTSRLNPHFLFNSLNTLTAVVEEEPKKAVSYIQELSTVYRYVLNSQKNTWVDLPQELKFTNSYIQLLKMRFEDNLMVNLDICEKHSTYCILPLTIQLLIENAVKHNEISNTHALNVQIYCQDEMLIVSNNKQKRIIMPSSTRVGLHNISERYKFLVNREVIIEDLDDSFTVKIPLVKLSDSRLDIDNPDHEDTNY